MTLLRACKPFRGDISWQDHSWQEIFGAKEGCGMRWRLCRSCSGHQVYVEGSGSWVDSRYNIVTGALQAVRLVGAS